MSAAEYIDKGIALLKVLTWKRVSMAAVAGVIGLAGFTMFENRQQMYDRFNPQLYAEDYPLVPPKAEGQKIIRDFMTRNPEVALITLIDADPVRNVRFPIYRAFNNEEVERVINAAAANGQRGDGPLFNNTESNNKQIIAIMNGEFFCTPVNEGEFARLFPTLTTKIKYSCRAPLPPAFNKATGWFSMHLTGWPPKSGFDNFKFDALNMSLAYFNAEIAKRSTDGPRIIR